MLGIIIGDQPNHIINLNNIKTVLTKVKNNDYSVDELDVEDLEVSLRWVDDLIETYNHLERGFDEKI